MNSQKTKRLLIGLTLTLFSLCPAVQLSAAPSAPYAAQTILEEPVNAPEKTIAVRGAVDNVTDWSGVLIIIVPVFLTVIFQLLLLKIISKKGFRSSKPNVA